MFLFISFKNNDGTWSTPQKMNEKMGFSDPARFPSISPDGKYIFFCGDDGNIYWVNRTIVDQFK
jgi:Tol biopolymer transport system component